MIDTKKLFLKQVFWSLLTTMFFNSMFILLFGVNYGFYTCLMQGLFIVIIAKYTIKL